MPLAAAPRSTKRSRFTLPPSDERCLRRALTIFAVTAVAAARELVAEAAAAMVVRRRGERTGKEKQEGILVSTQPQCWRRCALSQKIRKHPS